MQAVRIMLRAIALVIAMLLAGYPTASSGIVLGAPETSDAATSAASLNSMGIVAIGAGGGNVDVGGGRKVEVFGYGREVAITGNVDTVVISGQNCAVQVVRGVRVREILLTESAAGSKVTVDGAAGRIQVRNGSSMVEGAGFAGILQLAHPGTPLNIAYNTLAEFGDLGLLTASMNMGAPPALPAGETLTASVNLANAVHSKICTLTWYIDGSAKLAATVITGNPFPGLNYNFAYSRDMPENAVIKADIKYIAGDGKIQTLTAEKEITLENYDKRHWIELAAPGVLEKVTSQYAGDRTLQWAEENDYDSFEKEVWINAQGYESETEYLIWVNLTYQRANFFQKAEDGLWELIRSCIIASGRNGTPRGVTSVSYKLERGWIFDYYRVKPATYFYSLTGYGFHSRLYRHNMTDFYDDRIGFPISDGCIRMYDEDAWYIFDEIPIGTTVVIH